MTGSDTEELRLINAVIGFCKRMRSTWPRPLHQLGYAPCGVEWDIKVLLDNKDRTVPADLICASERLNHALCIEAKSSVVDEDQARRYRAVTRANLLNSGAMPPRIDAVDLTHDVVYVASRHNVDKVTRQLSDCGITFAIISAAIDRFSIAEGEIGQREVHETFERGIEVDPGNWPSRFVPFTSRSDAEKVAPFFCRALTEVLLNGRPFVLEQLAERAVPHWQLCGPNEKKNLQARLVELLEQGRLGELRGYYAKTNPRGAPRTWTPTAPQLLPPHETQRLARKMIEFRSRISSGKVYEEPPYQMPMFSELPIGYESKSPVAEEDDEADWREDEQ